MPESLLVAIPVFNEARHLDRVLDDVARYACDVLVVDDGSTDATPHVLHRRKRLHVVTHPENCGYGQSLSDAFRFARDRGYRWLITMDADGQHEARTIPAFISAAREDEADVISGTRYPAGSADVDVAVPADRRRINRSITRLLNRDLHLRLTDAFCGFKAYRVGALSNIRITVPGYAMPMQFWVQAARANLRIRELPVTLIYDDPNRHFGGDLDDPAARLRYYLDVYDTERNAPTTSPVPASNATRPIPNDPVGSASRSPCLAGVGCAATDPDKPGSGESGPGLSGCDASEPGAAVTCGCDRDRPRRLLRPGACHVREPDRCL